MRHLRIRWDGRARLKRPCRFFDRMASRIVHRGPDEDGFYLSPDGATGLGHRRLSIIDLSAGHQPMTNEDGTLTDRLQRRDATTSRTSTAASSRRGHVFRTHCDTETILHLYEEKGPACVEDLRGMFAFAIWDSRSRSLFLARDRVGVKPLYYRMAGGAIAFGSEIKSILADKSSSPAARPGRARPLSHLPVRPAPDDDVRGHLEAPARAQGRLGGGPPDGRALLDARLRPRGPRQAKASTSSARARCSPTRRRCASCPTCRSARFLSGGIDSSITVALMALGVIVAGQDLQHRLSREEVQRDRLRPPHRREVQDRPYGVHRRAQVARGPRRPRVVL